MKRPWFGRYQEWHDDNSHFVITNDWVDYATKNQTTKEKALKKLLQIRDIKQYYTPSEDTYSQAPKRRNFVLVNNVTGEKVKIEKEAK